MSSIERHDLRHIRHEPLSMTYAHAMFAMMLIIDTLIHSVTVKMTMIAATRHAAYAPSPDYRFVTSIRGACAQHERDGVKRVARYVRVRAADGEM